MAKAWEIWSRLGSRILCSRRPRRIRQHYPLLWEPLIELSTATNQPEEVKKWQAERAKYPEAATKPGEKK